MKFIINLVFGILSLICFAVSCNGHGGGIIALFVILIVAVILHKIIGN